MLTLVVLAAASGASSPDLTPLYVYGPLGVFMAAGLWAAKTVYQRMNEDLASERAYTRDLERQLRSEIMPLLVRLNETTADAIRVITEARVEIAARRRGEGP